MAKNKAAARIAAAERAYSRAAELARSSDNHLALAHALRHLSDIAREKGALEKASAHASEAVALYRGSDDRLGLANALRLYALAIPGSDRAASYWREARDLYSSLDVSAGVSECDAQLGI